MKKHYQILPKNWLLGALSLFICQVLFSQKTFQEKNIDTVFQNYTKFDEEVIYVHINKSKFISGEAIGFTIYAFDKKSKLLSPKTSNVYCVIKNSENKVIKEQLIKAEKGVASGVILIDQPFLNGTYTFNAYTNWMLNFSPQNIFVESFEIIDVNASVTQQKIKRSSNFDAQFLPESGHLLEGVLNTMGVVVKDSLGFGIGNISGAVYNSKNIKITTFSLNKMGIGRFSFTPILSENYTVIFDELDSKLSLPISEKIEPFGIILKVSQNNDEVLISAFTNQKSHKNFKEKNLKVTFHNGENLESFPLSFKNDLIITKKIASKNLTKGINVFTLFDENNHPITERIIFNYEGLQFLESNIIAKKNLKDSVSVSLKFNSSEKINFNNVSISVLPKETKSYEKNENIISQTYLKPYIKGVVENAEYYFSEISNKTKYDLDNLLITQGWSSYDWTKMFNYEPNITHSFENGISINVNIPNMEDSSNYFIHKLSDRGPELISFDEKIKSFTSHNYYPKNGENLYISKVNNKGTLQKTPLYVQFNPYSIPKTLSTFKVMRPSINYYTIENNFNISNFLNLNKTETLDEIVIIANLDENRRKDIRKKSFGRVYFIDKTERNLTLANYLNFKPGFRAFDNFQTGQIEVYNRWAGGAPAFFIDDFQVFGNDMLFNYWLNIVDYIEINPLGFGGGFASGGAGGIVKIFTDPNKFYVKRETLSKFEFPVTFTKPKKFYIPKYENYDDDFFKYFGVIDWLPINKIDEYGNLEITFKNNQSNVVTLYIEGVTEEGTFIVEKKTIKID